MLCLPIPYLSLSLSLSLSDHKLKLVAGVTIKYVMDHGLVAGVDHGHK